tara:strand:+ start:3848 stop:4135 length:288 start_codon:yes stop_codon:yes gene_type:complete
MNADWITYEANLEGLPREDADVVINLFYVYREKIPDDWIGYPKPFETDGNRIKISLATVKHRPLDHILEMMGAEIEPLVEDERIVSYYVDFSKKQ